VTLGNVQHYRAIIAYQVEKVFKFNHSIKLMLLESVSILLKKAENFLFFLRLLYIFYCWHFIIPLHQIQILYCKLTVIFVMVYWLLLTTNIKTPHHMHKTYLQN